MSSVGFLLPGRCVFTVQQLREAADLPAPAAQLLLGLQPGVRVPALPRGRRALRQAAHLVLHPQPLPAVQPLAVAAKEARRGRAAPAVRLQPARRPAQGQQPNLNLRSSHRSTRAQFPRSAMFVSAASNRVCVCACMPVRVLAFA